MASTYFYPICKPFLPNPVLMLSFQCLPFEQLSREQLYELMVLRQRVFVVEQDCPYLDADGKDPVCLHLLGRNPEGKLAAYARIVPPGQRLGHSPFEGPDELGTYPAIGRIVTAPEARGKGFGKKVVEEAIRQAEKAFGKRPIKIQAQEYLLKFYTGFGFERISETYLEDDIPHVDMVRR